MAVNAEYWKKRAVLLEEALHSQGLSYLESLERDYTKAIASVEQDIATWYRRFAKNNDISYAEAKRLLNSRELKEFHWRVEDYIAYGEGNALNQKWMKQLENASSRFHVSRIESLKVDLQQKVEVMYGNQLDGLETLLKNVYMEGYYRTVFEIQKGVGVGQKMQSLSATQLHQAVSKPWSTDAKTFSDRIWMDKEKLVNTVQTELTQTIIRGDAPDTAIKNLANNLESSKKQAGRLVMTELSHIQAESQKKCYEDLGVERYEIIASLDGKACERCGSMDKKNFPMSDYESGVTAHPFHPWCRCCTSPYHKDMEKIGQRFARDPKTGKSYLIPRNMKYEEWYREYVVDKYGKEEAALLKKMHENEGADKEQYKKYKLIYGENGPQTFAEFQEIKYNDNEKWEDLKAEKQANLNQMDYSRKMNAKFSNGEVRSWYNAHDKDIFSHIDTCKPLKDQAMQAHELRNGYKQQARNMMQNTKAAEQLNTERPLLDFDYYFDKYSKQYQTEDEVYKAILDSSTRPNHQVNKQFGLE